MSNISFVKDMKSYIQLLFNFYFRNTISCFSVNPNFKSNQLTIIYNRDIIINEIFHFTSFSKVKLSIGKLKNKTHTNYIVSNHQYHHRSF